jgi:hypothetical protein
MKLGGSVEEVEQGVSEMGRDGAWETVGPKGKRWGANKGAGSRNTNAKGVQPLAVRTVRGQIRGRSPSMRSITGDKMARSDLNKIGFGSPVRETNLIDKPGVRFQGSEINEAREKDGWERVRVQVDSGAIDTVAPKGVAAELPIRETRASKMGLGYVAANGRKHEHFGERIIKGSADAGIGVEMAFQVTDVKRPLGSVYRVNQTGHKVVLDGRESYMVHKKPGIITPIEEENGKYMFNIWVSSTERDMPVRKPVRSENSFAALAERDEEESDRESQPVFSWRDEIF